jgi:transposase
VWLPPRKIGALVNDALHALDASFVQIYAAEGRPLIAPEQLIRANPQQNLYSIHSERLLKKKMDYNLLFRWFVGLGIDDAVYVPTFFTKSRDRLLTTDVSHKIMAATLAHRYVAPLLSDYHFLHF